MTNDDRNITITPDAVTNLETATWQPVIGPETHALLERAVSAESRDAVQESAASVLGKAVPPFAASGQETGLIVGYVQSGKTLSFTTVTTLARDNNFQLVIVIAGTSTPLLDQSTRRLRKDLSLDDANGRPRTWVQLTNPENDEATRRTLRQSFEDWRDPEVPDRERQSILITVLKNHRRLAELVTLLASFELTGVPALVIDDEADQASLNTEIAQGQQSSTYRRITDLKRALPHHTYLQYTATPQAPLLINIIDALSPNFVEVLEPGADYTGGAAFFNGPHRLVRTIPAADVPTTNNAVTAPPASLLEALRIFMIGVSAGLINDGGSGNRSMLVHPSHRIQQHSEYVAWIRDIFDNWRSVLDLAATDPDRLELLADFQNAYDDVAATTTDLPAFDIVERTLKRAFRKTEIAEVNQRDGETRRIDWSQSYGWILVGGQALDRGYTVEGLTVTYMPRGIGVGNADTIQQRARFFGYRRRYLGYCRVYLELATQAAFRSYVEHEEDIRSQLQLVRESGESLNLWKRAFILSPRLRPCRTAVVDFDYMRGEFSDDWFIPQILLSDDSILQANRETLRAFEHPLTFIPDEGSPNRTDTQRHEVAKDVPLGEAMSRLLIPYRVIGTTDSQKYTGLLLQLSKAMENGDELCDVYRMSPTNSRFRSVDELGQVGNLFQGESPVMPRNLRGTVYPGDRNIHAPARVSIQIHRLLLKRDNIDVARDVVVLPVWTPSRLAKGWLVQNAISQA